MANPFVEELMTTLVCDVKNSKQPGEFLKLHCLVDEWRYDDVIFINMKDQIEKERWDLMCAKCREPGHEAAHCRELWCTECKVIGHEEAESCRELWCPECNMAGHVCRGFSFPCKLCGEAGHLATDCRQPWCTKCQIIGKYNYLAHIISSHILPVAPSYSTQYTF